ncbi:MAG: cysteine desulfurase family protein, partial [Alphaproteobacteria bacterium]
MNVYLDHNATTPARAGARQAALEAIDLSGNASSVHHAGRRAKAMLDHAREQVANLVGVGSREVVFTSGGTEANNLALLAFGVRPLLVSAIEHPSVLNVRKDAAVVPVGQDGCLDLGALEQLLLAHEDPAVVSVMAANNETGVVQPIGDIVSLAHEHGALVHSDAVQAAGKIDDAWRQADLVTLSGHKLGGVQGAGALIVRKHVSLKAVMGGGGQELGMRPGTEALPAIAGFGVAAQEVVNDDMTQLASWRDALEQEMLSVAPDAVVLGAE